MNILFPRIFKRTRPTQIYMQMIKTSFLDPEIFGKS